MFVTITKYLTGTRKGGKKLVMVSEVQSVVGWYYVLRKNSGGGRGSLLHER